MRLLYPILIMLTTMIFIGCIDDSTDDCPINTEENFILKFRYQSNGSEQLFTQRIQQVTVFIFNQEGKYIATRTVNLDDLMVFPGITMNLEPGNYRIICWGNISSRTFISTLGENSTFTNASLSNTAVRNGTAATDGDLLYYASDNISLSSPLKATTIENIIERTLNFKSAHIKVQVYVKGLIDKNSQEQLVPPIVKMVGISGGYNFLMQTSANTINYLNRSSFQNISNEEIAAVTFYTPRFTDNNIIQILIKKGSDGSTLTSIKLKDFMKENNITVEGVEEAVVPILIEYKQASVEISIPEWVQTPVEPEL